MQHAELAVTRGRGSGSGRHAALPMVLRQPFERDHPAWVPVAAAGALVAFAVQAVTLSFSPRLYALASPVTAACLLFIVLVVHPSLPTVLRRAAELQTSLERTPSRSTLELFLSDPELTTAMSLPGPGAAWSRTAAALALHALSDLSDGLRFLTGAPFWTMAHEALAAASACGFLYAALPLGVPPTKAVRRATWTTCACGGFLLCLAAPPPRASDGWWGVTMSALATCRALGCTGLLAKSACALFGALGGGRPADGSDVRPEHHDVGRFAVQSSGSLLLLGAPVMSVALQPAPAGFLALGASRLGVAALALATSLGTFPPLLGDGSGAAGTAGAYETVDEMRAARRAAREAQIRKRAEAPPPLLVDASRWGNGGVQGLRWHDLALCRDRDGDEAHDFWEAVRGGIFRRCSFPAR